MPKFIFRAWMLACFASGLFAFSADAAAQSTGQSTATIRAVSVLDANKSGRNNNGSKDAPGDWELQITSSQPVTPQAQIVVRPYRLVIDLPNSTPGAGLHNLLVNRGDVKGIRVGQFAKNPPVTRLVLDLKAPIVYQISASGQNVVFKLSSASRATAIPSNGPGVADLPVAVVAPPKPRVEVHFNQGLMSIHADKASLAEVLVEVRRQTGADIQIPPGADQEQVFSDLGPASPREVMSALLNGSRFNFVVVGSESDPNTLRSLILTSRSGGGISMPAESSSAQDSTPQQFPNTMQPAARQDMRNAPDSAVQQQMPAEQEDPGDTPPPVPPGV
jgi:AMIN domain